jgi:hypothetical protein
MIPTIPDPSLVLLLSFIGLLVVTIGAALAIVRRYVEGSLVLVGAVIGAWMIVSGAVAVSGLASQWDMRPPPALILFVLGFIGTVAISQHPRSRAFARQVPVAVLIGFQAFRFPLELILHRAWVEGLMPIQMSYAGQNYDIATGLLAIALGLWGIARPLSRWITIFFNLVGLTLLFNIVGIAIASTPVIQAFGPDHLNVWVAEWPFIWLPTVFVLFALLGHLLLMGRVTAEAREARALRASGGS